MHDYFDYCGFNSLHYYKPLPIFIETYRNIVIAAVLLFFIISQIVIIFHYLYITASLFQLNNCIQ